MIKPADNPHRRTRVPKAPTDPRIRRGNMMALATIASVVVSTIIGLKLLSPLLHAAAIAPFYHAAMKKHEHRTALILVTRWGFALFVTVLVLGVFAEGRMGASLPYAASMAESLHLWVVNSDAPPPGGYPYMLWGMAAFLAVSFVSGGFLGFVLGAMAVTGAAYGALFVLRHGYNILQLGLFAVPPWQWCLLASAVFFLIPAGLPMFSRYFGVEKRQEDFGALKTYMLTGTGLLGLALILRLAAANLWRTLLERWTVLGGP